MSESRTRDTYVVARRAVAELEKLGAPATAAGVSLWIAHLGGMSPSVTAAIKPLIVDPARATEAELDALHAEFLTPGASAVVALGGLLAAQLRKASGALAEAGGRTEAFGVTLDEAVSALSDPIRESALRALVLNLADATEQMRQRAQDLEHQLGETSGAILALRDDLSRARAEALTDSLTGLANRKGFDEYLEVVLADAGPSKSRVSVVLCDIDNFKAVNDKWGHRVGDHVIRFVARVLREQSGPHHLVARYGGEEMAIVAPGAGVEDAMMIAEKARVAIAAKMLSRRTNVKGVAATENLGRVTVSFGVAELGPGEQAGRLIERADAALYASKRGGRNLVTSAETLRAA